MDNVKEVILLRHSRGANQTMVYPAAQSAPEMPFESCSPGVDDSGQRLEDHYGKTFDEKFNRMKARRMRDAGLDWWKI
jgi:hypothetical protein